MLVVERAEDVKMNFKFSHTTRHVVPRWQCVLTSGNPPWEPRGIFQSSGKGVFPTLIHRGRHFVGEQVPSLGNNDAVCVCVC